MKALATLFLAIAVALPALPALAAEPVPEITRSAVAPQATGVLHGLRTIPEACVRLQGEFTRDPAAPYRFASVHTRATCQPRARFLDADKVKPSTATGWILNDRISVPSAACPSQHAVVTVWRLPADASPPDLDAQGRARIYLDASMRQARAGKLGTIPAYAASMVVQGAACR